MAYTLRLAENICRLPEVVGLIACGSMAQEDYQPDPWSDHDFLLIVEKGAQERFRTDLFWLPGAQGLLYSFRETEHGLKAVLDSGHLLEFAVFDPEELHLAKINRARVLFDRGGIHEHLARVKAETRTWITSHTPSDEYLKGQFLANLLVGWGRYSRGEMLSGITYICRHSLGHLITLLHRHVASPRSELVDNLDPLRRFEQMYPALGEQLAALFRRTPAEQIQGLIQLAQTEFPTSFWDRERPLMAHLLRLTATH